MNYFLYLYMYNKMSVDNKEYIEKQWKDYMGDFTNLSIYEAYDIYTRPGAGGKSWTKQEKELFTKISSFTMGSENPYAIRFLANKESKELEQAYASAMDDTDPRIVKTAMIIMDSKMTHAEKTEAIWELFKKRKDAEKDKEKLLTVK